ncbi:hypothetical protein ABI062_15345, partial [Enterococcus faecium]|uniref:hypothetical protein n=1 Tax=Enterococcus faecium TaxID=1352 RepID=UPI003F43E740
VLRIESLAQSRGFDSISLWVLSAGYGLVAANADVKPYSATFARGEADSVLQRTDGERRSALRLWWSLRTRSTSTIASVAARDPDSSMLVVA